MRLFRVKELGLVLVILLIAACLALFGGRVSQRTLDGSGQPAGRVEVNKFLQVINIDQVLKNASWTAVMAVGATLLIISGGIDLSVGAVYCLAAVCGGMFLHRFGPAGPHVTASPVLVVFGGVFLTLLIGLSCGLLNGAMVVLLRVHPFIVTLGTMSIFRGIAFVATQGQAITDYPPQLGTFFRFSAGDVTLAPLLSVLAVALAGYVFLQHTISGRRIYAVGGNETAALYSGINIGRTKLLVFTLAGLAAGIGAVITLGTFGSADSSTGRGYELDVIAAAVVGGASLTGGRGTALGAVLGALVIQLIANGIVILEIDQNYTEIIKGGVIIIAVVMDRIGTTMTQRRVVPAEPTVHTKPGVSK